MDNLKSIKFKHDVSGWYSKVDLKTGDRTVFKNGNGSGSGLYLEMMAWVADGNEVEQQYTDDELTEKEAQEKVNLYNSFLAERKTRLIESDKWELPSILILIDKTIENVISYKQHLRDMTETLTIDSDVSIIESPPWPEKLTDKELL